LLIVAAAGAAFVCGRETSLPAVGLADTEIGRSMKPIAADAGADPARFKTFGTSGSRTASIGAGIAERCSAAQERCSQPLAQVQEIVGSRSPTE
jgi:hypothetical protein